MRCHPALMCVDRARELIAGMKEREKRRGVSVGVHGICASGVPPVPGLADGPALEFARPAPAPGPEFRPTSCGGSRACPPNRGSLRFPKFPASPPSPPTAANARRPTGRRGFLSCTTRLTLLSRCQASRRNPSAPQSAGALGPARRFCGSEIALRNSPRLRGDGRDPRGLTLRAIPLETPYL